MPVAGRRSRSGYATALRMGAETGIGADKIAEWLGQPGGIEVKIEAYRKSHPRAVVPRRNERVADAMSPGAPGNATVTDLVIKGLPEMPDGEVTLTVEITDGVGRFIRHVLSAPIPDVRAAPASPLNSGDTPAVPLASPIPELLPDRQPDVGETTMAS
jgi:hypothetical protein